jgi:hypothetical protein
VTSKISSLFDAAIGVLERAAPAQNQRVRALKFLRGRLHGQPPDAGETADRPTNRAADHQTIKRPAKH